jgi:hypothetical protein
MDGVEPFSVERLNTLRWLNYTEADDYVVSRIVLEFRVMMLINPSPKVFELSWSGKQDGFERRHVLTAATKPCLDRISAAFPGFDVKITSFVAPKYIACCLSDNITVRISCPTRTDALLDPSAPKA